MKKFMFLLVSFVFILVSHGNSQDSLTHSREITVQKVFGGYNFIMSGKKLTVRELVRTMKPYEAAYAQMKSAQKDYNLATAASVAGGFITGWQLGALAAGESPKWEMFVVGAGVALVSIPFVKRSVRKAQHAVELYNSMIRQSSSRSIPELRFCVNGGGIGLSVKIPIGKS